MQTRPRTIFKPVTPAMKTWQNKRTSIVRGYRIDPEYKAEITAVSAHLEAVRNEGAIGIPLIVCGVSVRQLTLRDIQLFAALSNPLIEGGQFSCAHALEILWIMSDKAKPGSRAYIQGLKRRLFIYNILNKKSHKEIMVEVASYVDRHFIDAPGRYSEQGDEQSVSPLKMPWSLILSFSDCILRAYPGVSFDYLINIPLPMFWQFYHMSIEHLINNYNHYDALNHVAGKYRKKYEEKADKELGSAPDS